MDCGDCNSTFTNILLFLYSLHQLLNENVSGVLALGCREDLHPLFEVEVRDFGDKFKTKTIHGRGHRPNNVVDRT